MESLGDDEGEASMLVLGKIVAEFRTELALSLLHFGRSRDMGAVDRRL